MSSDNIKVSVVVATYRSGAGLDRVIRSLDRQSLPTDEWEAIFVDDGSPDDTFKRLQKFAETRPNMRVVQIENSGWPCRPRNTGTDMARGEYVAYMDHDDELYPHALRDGYAYAHAAGADVLNGKEARTHDAGWAIDTYRADSPQVRDATDMHPLIPANPHKLYRRAFLNEHGIRFREGGRIVWEDIFFNLLVAKHAQVISTMASTPYYHWYETAGSGSTTFRRSRDDWWDWLEVVIRAIDEDLAGDALATQRMLMRRHQYRSRLIGTFNNAFERRPAAERAMLFRRAKKLQDEYFTPDDDSFLARNYKMRAQLLRDGQEELLGHLVTDDPTIPGDARVTAARFVDGVVEVDVHTTWQDSKGRRLRNKVVGERVIKDLPSRFDGVFPADLLDVTDDIAGATVEIGVRSQRSRIVWMVPTESTVHWADRGRSADFSVSAVARIDPRTAAMGKPLNRGIWQLTARCTLETAIQHRMTPGDIVPAISLDAKGCAAVYTRPDGKVVLDYDQTGQPLTALVHPNGRARREGGRTVIEVEGLPGTADWSAPTKVWINPDGAAKRFARSLLRTGQQAFGRPVRNDGWYAAKAEIRVVAGIGEVVLDRVPDSVRIRIGALRPGDRTTYALHHGHRLEAITERPDRVGPALRKQTQWLAGVPRRVARKGRGVLRGRSRS